MKSLFALSGNLCAFDGCRATIINESGDLHGEVAHIRAVGKQGKKAARRDPNATAEELREFENLVLLCHEHHIETDKEEEYPVSRMKEMKAKHETKYRGLISGLLATVGDQTKRTSVVHPLNLAAYRDVYTKNPMSDQEILSTKESVIRFIDRLAKLPANAKAMLAIIADRVDSSFDYYDEISIPVETLRSVMELSHTEFNSILTTLVEYDYVIIDSDYNEPWRGERIILKNGEERESGLQLFSEAILISRALKISIEKLIVDLDWSGLDE